MKNDSSTSSNNAPAKLPVVLNIGALGLLAGISCSVQFGLLPVLNHLNLDTYLALMQGLAPTFTRVAMPLIGLGFVTFLYRLAKHQPRWSRSHWVTATSFVFFIAGIAITLAGLFPLNRQMLHWSAQNSLADLETLRSEWSRLNFWRFAVAQIAFVTGVLPLLCRANLLNRSVAANKISEAAEVQPIPGQAAA